MTYPRVPTFAKTQDWPRKAADAINSTLGRVGTLETTSTVLVAEAAASTVVTAQFAALGDYVDDAAAATGGVAVGELYRTGSIVKIRVT